MPKETFYNLPEEKRKKIEDAAIQEFKDYSFDTSSINRIVESSGISKGSFYQYFDDKKDLYKHIISIIVEKKIKYMSPVMMNPFNHNFYTLMREIYKSGLSFAMENPQLLEIGNKLIADTTHPIYIEIIDDNKGKSDEMFELLLKNAMERGEIRENLDLKMISYILSSLNLSIVDYYTKLTNKREYNEEMMVVVEKFLDFVQYGISKIEGDGSND
ncbi:TetR family transcriptional regulator [Alkalibaculum sp. M08DMB]|uniref:TetR family transcriptional regulator n=1 Tax=Alkalibaculum sporogenes TaxID=2655001 RepID=A0A6A7K9N5_9FIRM|nr:TetR/AcrR family transcriptional regulator [Alkalibaculum sporogenes]MPW26106.1 TetR family transcriptional regulator [Alkalibaculum sporogenes]